MVNWNSKESTYKPIRSTEVIEKAEQARAMYGHGLSVKVIAETLSVSKSRIYEYLRKDFLQNTLGSE